MPISSARSGEMLMPHLEQIVRERRGHRRHREKERELGGRRPIETHGHAADDRRAGPRHAGDERQHLAQADAERARDRRALGMSATTGDGPVALDHEHHDTAGDEGDRDHRRDFRTARS